MASATDLSSETSLASDRGVNGESNADVAAVSVEVEVEETIASEVEEEDEEMVGSSVGAEAVAGEAVAKDGSWDGGGEEEDEAVGGGEGSDGGGWRGFGVVDDVRGGEPTAVLPSTDEAGSGSSTSIAEDDSTASLDGCSTTPFCWISTPSPSPVDGEAESSSLSGESSMMAATSAREMGALSPASLAFALAFFFCFLIELADGPGLSAFLILTRTFLSIARAGAIVAIVAESGRVVTSMRSGSGRHVS